MSYTPYVKQTWDTTSYVNPTRMNHIEDGIKSNSDGISSLNTDLTNNHYTKTQADAKFATNSDLANIFSARSLISDFDSFRNGIGYFNAQSANKPSASSYGICVCMSYGSSGVDNWVYQVAFDTYDNICARSKINTANWSAWKLVSKS